jgi:micrococcal nuclease
MILLLWACSGEPSLDSATDTGSIEQGDGLDEYEASDFLQGNNPCREPELATLESVVDGDTAWFTTTQGSELVRFTGINTPEMSWEDDPGDCYAEEATEKTQELLAGGRAWLTYDEECEDHYDRSLAYLHIGVGEQGFVQRVLLQGGFASTMAIEPNTSFASSFALDESQAQSGDMGMWGSCAR